MESQLWTEDRGRPSTPPRRADCAGGRACAISPLEQHPAPSVSLAAAAAMGPPSGRREAARLLLGGVACLSLGVLIGCTTKPGVDYNKARLAKKPPLAALPNAAALERLSNVIGWCAPGPAPAPLRSAHLTRTPSARCYFVMWSACAQGAAAARARRSPAPLARRQVSPSGRRCSSTSRAAPWWASPSTSSA